MNSRTVLFILLGVLALVLVAPPAFAGSLFGDRTEAEAEADADARAHADADARSHSEGGDAHAGALGVGIVKTDTDVTVEGDVYEAPDVEAAARQLQRRAASAADSRSSSSGNNAACGDSTGLSGQAGIAGGSLSTVPEACRAFRAMAAEAQLTKNGYTKRATAIKVAYWIGFPFRTILHIASFGVLN